MTDRLTNLTHAQPGTRVDLAAGEGVLLEALGALAVRTEPAGELALVVDLAGKLNKRPDRVHTRYLMAPGQAGELIAEILVAAQALGDAAFAVSMEAALARKQRELGLRPEPPADGA